MVALGDAVHGAGLFLSHTHAGSGYTDCYANTHAGSDGDTDAYRYAGAHASLAYTYAHANCHAGSDGYTDTHADGYADPGYNHATHRRWWWWRRIRASPADGYGDPDAAPHGYAGAGPYTRTHANTRA